MKLYEVFARYTLILKLNSFETAHHLLPFRHLPDAFSYFDDSEALTQLSQFTLDVRFASYHTWYANGFSSQFARPLRVQLLCVYSNSPAAGFGVSR